MVKSSLDLVIDGAPENEVLHLHLLKGANPANLVLLPDIMRLYELVLGHLRRVHAARDIRFH